MPTEATITNSITRELTRRGAWWTKIHGNGAGRNGTPDLLACHLGHFLAIEIKQARGRVAKLQAWELERIACAGGTGIIARNLDDVRQALDEIERDDQLANGGPP